MNYQFAIDTSGLALGAKRFLWTHCRPVFAAIRRSRRARREARDRRLEIEMRDIQKAFVERYGLVVQAGPFRGMRYVAESLGSALVPKLVGSYEAELHPMIEEMCRQDRPIRVIDIGCDEGYYAVGLALRLPSAEIYAFDISAGAREKCRELARLNEVGDRVIVEGECTADRLNEILRPGDLVISDCEGCEFYLMDPAKTPLLSSASMILEMHDSDYLELNITPTLSSRFRETHEIVMLPVQTRRAKDWASVHFLPIRRQREAIDEGRVLGQQWAWMRSKV